MELVESGVSEWEEFFRQNFEPKSDFMQKTLDNNYLLSVEFLNVWKSTIYQNMLDKILGEPSKEGKPEEI